MQRCKKYRPRFLLETSYRIAILYRIYLVKAALARKLRREESLEASVLESITREPGLIDPEEEAELADSVANWARMAVR